MTEYVISLVNNGQQHLIEIKADRVTSGDNLIFVCSEERDGEQREPIVAEFEYWAWYSEKEKLNAEASESITTDSQGEPILGAQQVSNGARRSRD